MMETVIAVGVGVVVGGGILTLVYRILVGDREEARLDAALAELGTTKAPPSSAPRDRRDGSRASGSEGGAAPNAGDTAGSQANPE